MTKQTEQAPIAPAKAGETRSAGKLRFPLSCYGFAFAADSTLNGAYGPQTAYAVRLPVKNGLERKCGSQGKRHAEPPRTASERLKRGDS